MASMPNPYRNKRKPKPLATASLQQVQSENVELQNLLPKLRPFQREAYEFATRGIVSLRLRQSIKDPSFHYDHSLLGRGKILLGDEMGLGKTVTSLAIMAHYKDEWPLLILCPASLRHMWPGEIEKFMPTIPPRSVYVIKGFNDVGFQKRNDIQVVVATYSLLQDRSAVAQLLNSKAAEFKCIIVDESHSLQARNSQRSKLALPILQSARRLVLLSGTPAVAKPVELWLQLHALAPCLFGKYPEYTRRYCDAKYVYGRWDVSGLSNAKELYHKLKQVMVRRLKGDVLDELPAKQRSVVPITITAKDSIKENQQRMKELRDTRLSIAELVGDDQRTASFEAKAMFNQAYQASGIAKAQAVAEYLVDWLSGSGTQKVLVFAHHKAVMDTLELAISKHLKGVGHIRIDGSVCANERANLVRRFQTAAQARVALLSMTAAGVGLTLTAASNVMFAELHYTPGVLAQCEDRAHRIGQRNAVNILYFICKDSKVSVDSQIWNMLGRKVGTLEQVIDGGSGRVRAALAATQIEQNNTKSPRQSVQQELTSFFAEMAPTDSNKKPAVAPKGSILSFFKKASVGTTSLPSKASQAKQRSLLVSKKSPTSHHTVAPAMVEWACNACTYINSKKQFSSLKCEMCHRVYDPRSQEELPMETPVQTSQSKTSTPSTSLHMQQEQARTQQSPMVPTRPPDVILLDDDADDGVEEVAGAKLALKPQQKRKQSSVVVIDIDSKPEPKKPKHLQVKDTLSFSISKNSGRITLHYNTGTSSLVNFDFLDVLTEETVIEIEENKTTRRRHSELPPTGLSFNREAIQKLVQRLDRTLIGPEAAIVCEKEIELFVESYLSLREVHRKALRDAGQPVSSKNLAQSAAKALVGGMALLKFGNKGPPATTDRYTGGAKERAQERLKEGSATQIDIQVLQGDRCAWCSGILSSASVQAKGVYCSQECAEEGRIRRGGMYTSSHLRQQVFALEGGVCQLCNINAHALFLRVKALPPAQRLSVLCNANWKLPKTQVAIARLLETPTEGNFWQVDHIKAVAEGGGGCGLENLRTLCVPCHVSETEKLRGRLRLLGAVKDNEHASKQKGKQADIRDLFGSSPGCP